MIIPNQEDSIRSSLELMQCKNNSFCFIQNADNPFIGSALLNELYESKLMKVLCAGLNGKRGHPAIIGNKIITRIRTEKMIP
jgi:CTP:molybdopterin cytidylyltransferase MocA